jgi:hypothetical protein
MKINNKNIIQKRSKKPDFNPPGSKYKIFDLVAIPR